MVLGLRVVRGPDWTRGDEDGGQDHVGTVVETKGSNSVLVQWDMGATSICRCGKDGKNDVLIFDSAPIGITHPGVKCSYCGDACIAGTRWTCSQCDEVHVCTPCYFDEEHDLNHSFKRIDMPGQSGNLVSKRKSCKRSRSLGMYANAKVKRGRDWEYENQDGGAGKIGRVEDVVSYMKDSSNRNAVRVQWERSKTRSMYRVGYGGKVDLQCVESAPGADFYREHLPSIDIEALTKWSRDSRVLKPGDLVCVTLTKQDLRQLQQAKHGWNNRMEEISGEVGEIKSFTPDGDIVVQFGPDDITLRPAAVKLVPSHSKGDTVRVSRDQALLKRLQRKHGGWDDEMTQVLGKVGTISDIDKDGDVGVTFEEVAFVFHPYCITPVPKSHVPEVTSPEVGEQLQNPSPTNTSTGSGPSGTKNAGKNSNDDDEEEEDVHSDFTQMMAGLILLGALARPQHVRKEDAFINACFTGRENDVRCMLQEQPSLGLPLLIIASNNAHLGVVKALLDFGADVNVLDDKQNSALIVSLLTGNLKVVELLIERGADLNIANFQGRTPLHVAAHKNLEAIVKLLLSNKCDPNKQDIAGDTPLHDAISERHDAAALLLMADQRLDVWRKNIKHFNPFNFACLKGHGMVVDKLLSREPGLVNSEAANGFHPLHITAINNHLNEANILLVKGRANVNVQNECQLTPLHLAVSEAHFDMVKLLLTHEADWEVKDHLGNTPLHVCLVGRRSEGVFLQLLGFPDFSEENERVKIANFLIQHGAKIDVTNNNGKTPLQECVNPRMRDAVLLYAQNNKPTKPEKKQTRPRTAKVENETFTESNQKCHRCSQVAADVRFLPCRHRVTCTRCCFRYRLCPVCNSEIRERVNNSNQTIDGDCVIL